MRQLRQEFVRALRVRANLDGNPILGRPREVLPELRALVNAALQLPDLALEGVGIRVDLGKKRPEVSTFDP